MITEKEVKNLRVGETISFTYNGKERIVTIEKIVLPPVCNTFAAAYVNGQTITNGVVEGYKSFTFVKMESPIVKR